MVNKVTPEGRKILKSLATARARLQRARSSEDDALKVVHDLIRTGFEEKISGLKLAEASGMSLPRVYQVRDEAKPQEEAVTSTAEE